MKTEFWDIRKKGEILTLAKQGDEDAIELLLKEVERLERRVQSLESGIRMSIVEYESKWDIKPSSLQER